VDFLFVLIELFSLGVTAEALRANIEYEQSHGLLATAKRLIWSFSGEILLLRPL